MRDEIDLDLDQLELDAYLDGALSSSEAQRVEARLAEDPAAASYVERARQLNDALGDYTRQIDQVPMSAGLEAALERLQPRAEVISLADRFPNLRQLQALAAGLFVLAVGFGSGFYMGGETVEQQSLAMQEVREQVRAEVRKAMNETLEYRPSGEVVSWKSDKLPASAELMPVRTFKTPDRRYCREFKEVIVIDGVREERRGLSCRVGQKEWQTRMLLAEEGQKTVF